MPPISIKKVLFWIGLIIVLVNWDQIKAFLLSVFEVFYDAFEPLRNSPPMARYIAALAVLSFCFTVIWKIILMKMR